MTAIQTHTGLSRGVALFAAIATVVALSGVSVLAGALQANAAGHANIADGDLIRVQGTNEVYIAKVVGGELYKRVILSPTVFDSYGHLEWDDVQDVSQAVADEFTDSNLVIEVYPNGTPVTGEVYELIPDAVNDTGTKHHLEMTPAEFEAEGYSWNQIYNVNHTDFLVYNTGAANKAEGSEEEEEEETTNTEGTMTVSRLVLPGNVEVDPGATAAVLGFSVEAENSNLNVQRVDVTLTLDQDGSNTASDALWEVVDSVSLYRDGSLLATTVGSKTNFEKADSNDALRLEGFSSNVAMGAEVDFEVRVAVAGLEDDDLDQDIQVSVNVDEDLGDTSGDAIRAVDGAGIQQYGGVTSGRQFTVPDDSAAALVAALSTDNYDEGVAVLDADNSGDAIDLLLYETEADNDTVRITDTVVTVDLHDSTSADLAGTADLGDYFTVLNLYANGTLVGTEAAEGDATVAGGVAISFADMEVDVADEETVEWRVEIVARGWDTDDAGTWEGYQVDASVAVTTGIVAEDSDGDAVGESGLPVAGNPMHLYSVAPVLTFVSGSLTKVDDDANGTLVFDVTAEGGDVFISADAEDGVTATENAVLSVTNDGGGSDFAFLVSVSGATEVTASGSDLTNVHRIDEGTTARVTVDINITGGTSTPAFMKTVLDDYFWSSDKDANKADHNNVPDSLLEDFETNSVSILSV